MLKLYWLNQTPQSRGAWLFSAELVVTILCVAIFNVTTRLILCKQPRRYFLVSTHRYNVHAKTDANAGKIFNLESVRKAGQCLLLSFLQFELP